MRSSDPRFPASTRPNLVTANHKRAAGPGGILDHIAPGIGTASHVLDLNPRWLWAGGLLVIALIGTLAAIAYENVSTERPLPRPKGTQALAGAQRPASAPAIARIERVDSATGFEQVNDAGTQPEAIVRSRASLSPASQERRTVRPSPGRRPATAPPTRRHAIVRAPSRTEPSPVDNKVDSDVELISALRKATETAND